MPSKTESDNIWQSILDDVAAHTKNRHLPTKNLVILGDEGSGKSSFIANIQKKKYHADDHPLGTGLEYTYIDVDDEETEETIGRLGVYTLDGNESHSNLLEFVINAETMEDVIVVITLDMSQPWNMMTSLKKWIALFEAHIERLAAQPAASSAADEASDEVQGDAPTLASKLDDLKFRLVNYWKEYQNLVISKDSQDDEDDGEVLLDLPEGALETNLGIPIIIVVTKTDTLSGLRKDRDYQNQHFDFMQMHLRQFALTYGAALIYTGRDTGNRDSIYRYLMHRAYGFAFRDSAFLANPEAVLIPAGWDSPIKIQELQEGLRTISSTDEFDAHFKSPARSQIEDPEICAEDEQDFLKKQSDLMGKSIVERDVKPSFASKPMSTSSSSSLAPAAKILPSVKKPVAAQTSSAAASGKAAQGPDVLKNFFDSLLTNKK